MVKEFSKIYELDKRILKNNVENLKKNLNECERKYRSLLKVHNTNLRGQNKQKDKNEIIDQRNSFFMPSLFGRNSIMNRKNILSVVHSHEVSDIG